MEKAKSKEGTVSRCNFPKHKTFDIELNVRIKLYAPIQKMKHYIVLTCMYWKIHHNLGNLICMLLSKIFSNPIFLQKPQVPLKLWRHLCVTVIKCWLKSCLYVYQTELGVDSSYIQQPVCELHNRQEGNRSFTELLYHLWWLSVIQTDGGFYICCSFKTICHIWSVLQLSDLFKVLPES